MRWPAALNLRVVIRPAILSLFVVLLVPACGDPGDGLAPLPAGGFEPERPPVLATLEVSPTVAGLSTVAPANTVQLTVMARDQTGARMPGAGATTFSSSAPAIAGVSSRGVVTPAAPGTAAITATLTLGGITRTASMTATVHGHDEAPGAYREIAGVYDLTALITSSDPAWGIEEGTRQTAVITIQHSRDTPQFAGTFADFRAIGPGGESLSGSPGFVSGFIDLDGRVVIALSFEGSPTSYWYGEGMLAARQIVGTFGAGGHIGGTFTAERRQAE